VAGVAAVGAGSAAFIGTAQAVSPQPNWAFCNKCNVMWYNGNTSKGACPAGGTHHIDTSYNYVISNNLPPGSGGEPNWRWCSKCQGLYSTLNTPSYCMGNNAGYGPHTEGAGSFDYWLFYNEPIVSNPQAYWRWCKQCQGLYFQGASGTGQGICPMFESPSAITMDVPYGVHVQGSTVNYDLSWNGYLPPTQ
jgi:hypothetical protein